MHVLILPAISEQSSLPRSISLCAAHRGPEDGVGDLHAVLLERRARGGVVDDQVRVLGREDLRAARADPDGGVHALLDDELRRDVLIPRTGARSLRKKSTACPIPRDAQLRSAEDLARSVVQRSWK